MVAEAQDLGFEIRYFDIDESYNSENLPSEQNCAEIYQNLRKFYETIILDLFSDAVSKIPKNAYNITEFRDIYFDTLEEYDNSLKKMYEILDRLGFAHDHRNIYVDIEEGLFSINIFTGACYFHYPHSCTQQTKYLCLEPAIKDFSGWSNIMYLPKTFMLSIAKAFYLLEHDFDNIVLDQLEEIKKKLM